MASTVLLGIQGYYSFATYHRNVVLTVTGRAIWTLVQPMQISPDAAMYNHQNVKYRSIHSDKDNTTLNLMVIKDIAFQKFDGYYCI